MVINAFHAIKKNFERFNKPDGGKDSPGKTCRDIKMAYPEKPSGMIF